MYFKWILFFNFETEETKRQEEEARQKVAEKEELEQKRKEREVRDPYSGSLSENIGLNILSEFQYIFTATGSEKERGAI